MRPLYNEELTTFRRRPQNTEYYVGVFKPQVVWMGNFGSVLPSGASDWPLNIIQASNTVSGNLNAITSGMTLWLGTAASKKDYGVIRIREAASKAAADAFSKLRVAETPCGLVNLSANNMASLATCLTVVNERGLWPIHLGYIASGLSAWEVDFDRYASQTAGCYGPLAVIGPPAVLWLDGANVNACFVGDHSYTFSPGGCTAAKLFDVTCWVWPTVYLTASASPLGSSKNPRVINFVDASPTGDYFSLYVRDTNGASHQTFRPIWAFNGSNASPYRVENLEITGGLREGGYTARFTLHDDAGSQNFIDGAQVVVFERASYNGVASSIGANGSDLFRRNIVFYGWLDSENVTMQPTTCNVVFTAKTVDGILKNTRAFNIFLESNSAVAASPWIRASNLNLNNTALVLVKYRSTISNVVDVNFQDPNLELNPLKPKSAYASALDIAFQSLPAGTLWNQLQQNYGEKGFMGLVAADMHSSIWMSQDIQATGMSSNFFMNQREAFLPEDIMNQISWESNHQPTAAQYRIFGFTTANARIASGAPGDPGGYFGRVFEIPRGLVCESQSVFDVWSGNLRAKEENKNKRIIFQFSGNLRYDSVPQKPIDINIPTASYPRSLAWHNLFLIQSGSLTRLTVAPYETNVRYNSRTGFATTELVCESIVDGLTGSPIPFA